MWEASDNIGLRMLGLSVLPAFHFRGCADECLHTNLALYKPTSNKKFMNRNNTQFNISMLLTGNINQIHT